MSYEIIELEDGTAVGTGALEPDIDYDCPVFADADEVRARDRKELLEIIKAPTRKSAAERYPSAMFINNQSSIGSCNGWACIQIIERLRANRGLPHIDLSGNALYSLMNGGRDQGSMLYKGLELLKSTGAPPEEWEGQKLVNSVTIYRKGEFNKRVFELASNFVGIEAFKLQDEQDLITAQALQWPCVVAVHVNRTFSKIGSDGIVPPSPSGVGNHSVTIDDIRWNESRNRFEFSLPNSWGRRWGVDGRGWVNWKDHLATTVKRHQFFAFRNVTSAVIDPKPPQLKG